MNDLTSVIQEIKDRLPIEAVVGARVQLQRKGGRLWGLCPFHAEKTPSFSVLPDRGIFKCFGCGQGGDAISFLRELDGLEFIEALRLLADQAGVELPQMKGGRSESDSVTQLRKQAREALAYTKKLYQEALYEDCGRAARQYLVDRKIDPELVKSFSVGWAPAEPGWLCQRLHQKGFHGDVVIEAGLASRSDRDGSLRDRFWDRLLFPVQELGDRTVGFGGRYLPGSRSEERKMGKYINSPETHLFPKRRLLYGLERLQQGMRDCPDMPIILCEGYLDVILLHQAGFKTAIAALGTALTEDHARRLRRYDRPVVLLLDPDEAGRRAAARGARILVREGVDVRAGELPDGLDPADMIATGQAEELSQRVAKAWDILDWRLTAWIQKADFRVPSVQSKAAHEMAEWLQTTPDPVLAEVWMRTACDRLGVTEQSLRRIMRSPGPVPNRMSQARVPSQNSDLPTHPAQEILRQNEQQIVSAILIDPSLAVVFADTLSELKLLDPSAGLVLNWCFERRKEGEDCSLDQALQEFSSHPAAKWLDKLRFLPVAEPRLDLERALEARPHNLERYSKENQPSQAATDADLERFRRSIPISPSRDQT
ncbi:MAG: DNA primase [Planctomycetes bacterium]|nr:DNA primase [Planctomycetota bacterium]